MIKHYDIIIVGSGIVGLTLASLLVKNNFSVALIEAKKTEIDPETYTARVSAIHENSARLFQSLSIWDELSATPMESMEIWDHTHRAHLHFKHDYSTWIIENRAVITALEKQLASRIDFYRPNHPVQFSADKILTLDDGTALKPTLLVGADGAESWVRNQMQTPLQKKSYEQKAIIAVIHTEIPHGFRAYQKFLTTGPVALLPLKNQHHTALVWSADNPISDTLMQLPDEIFASRLTDALDFKLGNLSVLTKRQQFPLIMRHVDNYVDPLGTALVGDSAHTIHPLAGLGVNLGLMDAAALTHILRKNRASFGDYRVLRRYARYRQSENISTINAMNLLKTVFAMDNPLINTVRSFAINQIDRYDVLKGFFKNAVVGEFLDD